MKNLREIILCGSAYNRGLQHGIALHTQINEFLKDGRARINLIRQKPLDEAIIQRQVKLHAAVIKAELPEIELELRGLAEGANISYEDAVLLQIRVELIAYGEQDMLEGDCSTFGINKPDEQSVTGQTIDLPGGMAELGCIFRIIPVDDTKPQILMYGFAGLLGYMGLNSKGLSVNINMVISNDWQPGISPYLLVRHLLTLSSVTECIDALQTLTSASSRSFLISDKKSLFNLEFTANNLQLIEGNIVLHTNHYLHPKLEKQDKMHFLFKNSSVKRLKLLQQRLMERAEEMSVDSIFDILSDHSLYPVGLCAHGEGNVRRSETVAAVVMEPARLLLHARKGYCCTATTKTFSFY